MSIRLLHCKTLQFKVFHEAQVPRYAILSHTWGLEEVTLQDMANSIATKKAGYIKITGTCRLALSHKIDYVWIDTCCIDKTDRSELAEAIRSMFRWYQNATVCYVYLSDLTLPGTEALQSCAWFTRGWTLQELLAPHNVDFYDRTWKPIGSKVQLATRLSEITLIPVSAVLGQEPLGHYSIAQRMSWASNRVTTHVEDTAYCLLGIFDVYILPIHGERERAFQRLQEEIVKRNFDLTVFAWLPAASRPVTASVQKPLAHHNTLMAYNPLFAYSPADFEFSYLTTQFRNDDLDFEVTNRGLRITTSLTLLPCSVTNDQRSASRSKAKSSEDGGAQRYRYVLPLGFSKNVDSYVGIWLKKIGSDLYLRENMSSLAQIPADMFRAIRTTESTVCYIHLNPDTLSSLAAGAPRTFPPIASHASGRSLPSPNTAAITTGGVSAAAKSSLHAVYHPRLYPEGIYVPNCGARGIYFNSFPPCLWDDRTRICCQPESLNDVVPFSCTSQQGPGGNDKLSFGVLLDFRDRSGPRCVVVNRLSPESSLVFLQTEPMKWHVLENNLHLQMGNSTLRFGSNSGRKYDVAASVVRGNARIDEYVVPMATLDIKITSLASAPAPTLKRRKY